MKFFLPIAGFIIILLCACTASKKTNNVLNGARAPQTETVKKTLPEKKYYPPQVLKETVVLDKNDFLNYAQSFLGTPYKYASSNPDNGFDCSGFLYHVFQFFNIKAPRASYQYEHVGKNIADKNAAVGDLILFTASDSTKIGHIGIITTTEPKIAFIHSSTSKGVIISPLSGYYEKHFVKIIRVLQ